MSSIPIHIAVEDVLSEMVLRRILEYACRGYVLCSCYRRQGAGYLKKNVRGFNNAAKGIPFLLLTDLDTAGCAAELIRTWLPVSRNPNFLFRVAVREVEAWLLADRRGFSDFLKLSEKQIPVNADDITDPKQMIVNLAKKCRVRELANAIAPRSGSTSKVGPDYNGKLSYFTLNLWDIDRALMNSQSLARCVRVIKEFRPVFSEKDMTMP